MNRFFFVLCFSLASCQTPTDDTDPIAERVDKDGDGFFFEDDCNDSDASIYPGAPENCDPPLVDSNCDGFIGGLDEDGDGFRACDDCNDGDDAVYPNAIEVCDGLDNDCDGAIDDEDSNVDYTSVPARYLDTDNDGFGDDDNEVVQCAPPENAREQGGDCDDTDPDVHPDAVEICDFKDNDCDGDVDRNDTEVVLTDTDPTCYPDSDSDGFGDWNADGLHTCFCATDEAANDGDCDDKDGAVRPDADFADSPAMSGSWDLNCDGDVEQQSTSVDGVCALASDGRSCDFSEGYVSSKAPSCGGYEAYVSACVIKKGTTGPFCEATIKDQPQRCR